MANKTAALHKAIMMDATCHETNWKESLSTAGAVFAPGDSTGEALHFGNAREEYAALTGGVGLADFSHRTQIELTGADRQTFLHNLCTNEIRRLTAGTGCEAFLCNAQGHVLALVNVFCGAANLVIETVPGVGAKLLAHLDRYLIREKVELADRSESWAELLLAGPGSDAILQPLAGDLPQQPLGNVLTQCAGVDVSLRRVEITQPHGYLLSAERCELPKLWQALLQAGARPCGSAAVETARIEAGTPYFGPDITDANLPQEIARDARAISFVKGCYIGQETVARLDALGHVNRTLVGVRFAGAELPAAGTDLTDDSGKVVGRVTSATFSPRLTAPLAFAYVRRETNTPGAKLGSSVGSAEVVALPI
jgi:folate-binding protein YgfZ